VSLVHFLLERNANPNVEDDTCGTVLDDCALYLIGHWRTGIFRGDISQSLLKRLEAAGGHFSRPFEEWTIERHHYPNIDSNFELLKCFEEQIDRK